MLWTFVAANVAVYVLWQLAVRQGLSAPFVGWMQAHFTVSLPGVLSGRVWTLLTSAFSHVDPMHLFFNMLALWVFGRDALRVIGRLAFIQLYLVGGLVASVGHIAYGALSGEWTPALGASGSVMAIAVVFAALYPRRILLINFFIPVPAALAVAAYLALDLFGALGGTQDNIAHAAHLGGAAYGLLWFGFRVWPRLRRPKVDGKVEGNDLIVPLRISRAEAAGGLRRVVVVARGDDDPAEVALEVPGGLKDGVRIRVVGGGLRVGPGWPRGDLMLVIRIEG